MKALVLVVILAATNPAAAQDAIVRPAKQAKAEHAWSRQPPIAIPQQFSPPQEAFASFPEPRPAAPPSPQPPSACQSRLAKLAVFKPLGVLAGPGECGAVDAVLLEGVILSDQTKVAVAPPATLRCPMAEQVALWLREDVAPAALKLGAPLRAIDDYDSYECRGRNRVRGATLSEHGRANALDVRGVKLANGEAIEFADVNVAKEWREELRAGTCARFGTVLGPGSDSNHEEHIHLDLAERRGGYKMCEWDVREPVKSAESARPDGAENPARLEPLVPLPRPRPAAIAADGIRPKPEKLR
ncbi:MAG TPA: extensin family protein [Xanthobacteraceae bacterium]|nr:extensin family protein [Xanthobacteraceae bacterium]